MNPITERSVSIVYSGDETAYRSKTNGLSLMDQFFLSLTSVRENWSDTVPVFFVHTQPLSEQSLSRMSELEATPIKSDRVIHPNFLMANKMLAYLAPVQTLYTLFLDNDTYVHKPVNLEPSQMMVAYDVLQGLPEDDFKKLFSDLAIDSPEGEYVEKPALVYYANDRTDLFPAWNSGVYLIETQLLYEFCKSWEEIFLLLFSRYIGEDWSFYLEQALFCVNVYLQKIDFSYFPKGYNYICTPRASELKEFPFEKVVIEHYAGNTSSPRYFSDKRLRKNID